MYEEFFGLTEKPFSIQPDPSFLYWGRGHRLAYAMLEYGVLNRAGISVVTGEVGCGKTTLVHRLLDNLNDTHTVALLSNIQQGRGDLLSWVLMGFGKPFAGKSHVELFSDLQTFFIEEYAKGRRVVLIIDEAQNLSIDMLEELRMLSNINAGKDQLLQLILVGQPQLKDLLNRPDMLQLAQRVGSDFHLTPLSREEVAEYLETRLSIAGAARRIFTESAIDLLAEQSRGVPRVINIIADTALVYAFSAQYETVDEETIADVIRDKSDYGVFGLASDAAVAKPMKREKQGPDAFVARPPRETLRAERGDEAAQEPALRDAETASPAEEPLRVAAGMGASARIAGGDDQPRMAPPRRLRAEPRAPEFRVEIAPSPPPPRPAASPAPPVEAPAAPAQSKSAIGVGFVLTGPDPASAIRAAGEDRRVVYVAAAANAHAQAARAAGAQIVEINDRALTPGRARNAGYRQLKKLAPDIGYVLFVDAGARINPDWIEAAVRFLERRPEVAAVDGPITERFARKSAFDAAIGPPPRESGEVQHVGPTALVRASAFEAAGGFRGDLPVNEMQDLCVRLRRRGAHVWRLSQPMAAREAARMGLSGWWSRALGAGYDYAHGAALHGAPPERLYAAQQLRALVWGGAFPLFIIVAAIAAGVLAAFFAPMIHPALATAGVLLFGALVYMLKIVIIAVRHGPLKASSWAFGALAAFGHIPEFFGALTYYRGKARPAPRAGG